MAAIRQTGGTGGAGLRSVKTIYGIQSSILFFLEIKKLDIYLLCYFQYKVGEPRSVPVTHDEPEPNSPGDDSNDLAKIIANALISRSSAIQHDSGNIFIMWIESLIWFR